MGRWLSRVLAARKISEAIGSDADITDETPSEAVLSVSSVTREQIFQDRDRQSGRVSHSSVSFVGGSGHPFKQIQQASHNHSRLNVAPPVVVSWEMRAVALEATGLPIEWAEPFAKLLCGPPPGDFDCCYWTRVLPGANLFASEWAAKAHAFGWIVEEVFGLDEVKPAARYDRKGVAWLLTDGARVVALDACGADIITKQGSRQRYRRRLGARYPRVNTFLQD